MAITYTTKKDAKTYENEGVHLIATNKTLVINKCTYQDSTLPSIVSVKSTNEVFEHYKPKAEVNLETNSGKLKQETFHFNKLEDFDIHAIAKQSSLLQSQKEKENYFLEVVRQIKQQDALKKILADKTLRVGLLELIQSLKVQLKEY